MATVTNHKVTMDIRLNLNTISAITTMASGVALGTTTTVEITTIKEEEATVVRIVTAIPRDAVMGMTVTDRYGTSGIVGICMKSSYQMEFRAQRGFSKESNFQDEALHNVFIPKLSSLWSKS
jgi:hypothetical protein